MKNRNPFAVALLPFVTLGIYGLYWEVKTKEEMKSLGADIPTAWLLIVPIVNYYWIWKYSQGVEKVTNGKFQGVVAFLLLALLNSIGAAIIQDSFNKDTAGASTPTSAPTNPTPEVTPTIQAPAPPVVTPPVNPVS